MSHPNTERDERVNDDDKAINCLLLGWGTTGNVDSFRRRVVEYIATVRKEARAAAFKDALGQVKLLWSTTKSDAYNYAINDVVRKIEAAANTDKGAGDG